MAYTLIHRGRCRVQNAANWAVYVGEDEMPDFSLAPLSVEGSLPANVSLPLPVSETLYYVVVRKRNTFGLESQNAWPTLIRLNAGGRVLSPVGAPTAFEVILLGSAQIAVGAKYASYPFETDPANTWKVWVSQSAINIADPPSFTTAVNGMYMRGTISGVSPTGTWNIALALFRAADSYQSALLEGTFIIPASPAEPLAVNSGFVLPEE